MAYQKVEQYEDRITSGLIENYRDSLALLGEDPEREGLLKTPERVAKAMQYLTQGYQMDAKAILESAKFHEDVSEMIIVKDIELFSMCEHHMLPFFGKAHIAYIPNGYITEFCFCTPRIIIQRCLASITTATPIGFRDSLIALRICVVSLS